MARRRKRAARESDAKADMRLVMLNPQEIVGGMVRKRLQRDEAGLALLAASIRRHGILSPIIVRRVEDRYALVSGARRLAACRMLGKNAVPAIVVDADEAQAAAIYMEEHHAGKKPCAIEEAEAISTSGGMQAAGESVLPRTVFARRLALLSLDESTRQIALNGGLSLEQAEPLRSIASQALRQEAAQIITQRHLTGQQARRLVFGAQEREDSGEKREMQTVAQEIERLRERLCAKRIHAQVSVVSRAGTMCIQVTLAGKPEKAEFRTNN